MSPSSSNLPLFLSLTGRERDEFLRALGLADYDDINLFNLLCSYAAKRATAKVNVPDLLAAVASWARSHRKPNLMGGAAKAALRRVVAALERNGYAATKEDPNTILLRDGERRAGQGDRAILEIEKIYRLIESDPLQSYPSSTSIAVPSTSQQTSRDVVDSPGY